MFKEQGIYAMLKYSRFFCREMLNINCIKNPCGNQIHFLRMKLFHLHFGWEIPCFDSCTDIKRESHKNEFVLT